MKTTVGASPKFLGRTTAASNQGRTMVEAYSGQKKLRANNVTALHDTRNKPLQRHQGIRKACVNGGRQCLSVVPILWLQVTSIDKRIDFPGSTSTVTNCLRNFWRLRKRQIRSAGVFGSRICGVSCGEEGIILPY